MFATKHKVSCRHYIAPLSASDPAKPMVVYSTSARLLLLCLRIPISSHIATGIPTVSLNRTPSFSIPSSSFLESFVFPFSFLHHHVPSILPFTSAGVSPVRSQRTESTSVNPPTSTPLQRPFRASSSLLQSLPIARRGRANALASAPPLVLADPPSTIRLSTASDDMLPAERFSVLALSRRSQMTFYGACEVASLDRGEVSRVGLAVASDISSGRALPFAFMHYVEGHF